MSEKWELPGFSLDLTQLGEFKLDSKTLESSHRSLQEKLQSTAGFYHWPAEGKSALEEVSSLSKKIKSEFDAVVCLGIGGSHLGAVTLLQALQSPAQQEAFPIFWGVNIDAPALAQAQYFIKKHKKVACVVISKSGGTLETLSNFYHLSSHFADEAITVITDPKEGELRRLANERNWNALAVPQNIGGRFSVLTAVGLLPAALGDLDIQEILSGANQLREYLDKTPHAENPAYQLAAIKCHLHVKEGKACQYLMPYSSALSNLAHWYVQLWAESLGKNGLGPTPAPALGSQDQHSLLQLLKDGPRNKLVGFVDVLEESSEVIGKPFFAGDKYAYLWKQSLSAINHNACVSTQTSLNRSGVPTYRIELPKLRASSLGALLQFFEVSCAFAAELYGVDAFDQPGVEEAKQLLRDALQKP